MEFFNKPLTKALSFGIEYYQTLDCIHDMHLLAQIPISLQSTHLMDLPQNALFFLVFFGYILYCCGLVVYRLYFSPLAKFPGPKLAAITTWYETYFELFKGIGGQYTFQIGKLHEQYGTLELILSISCVTENWKLLHDFISC